MTCMQVNLALTLANPALAAVQAVVAAGKSARFAKLVDEAVTSGVKLSEKAGLGARVSD